MFSFRSLFFTLTSRFAPSNFPRCALVVLLFGVLPAGASEMYRLPPTAVPEHYQLKFAPNLVNNSFAGDETIDVEIPHPTAEIVLNSAEIEFKSVEVTSAGQAQTAQVRLDADHEIVTLSVGRKISAGAAQIHILFNGILNDKLRGFYRANANGRKYAVTQFEARDARRAFPCFDEAALKATFSVTLVVDKGDTAISNGTILRDTAGPGDNKHTLVFSTTARMSSYLVAMAVGDFQCVEGQTDGIPIRVCATPDKKEQCRFALEAAEHLLHFYDQYFEIKYPFGKLDIVAAPDFAAGAMENTAAIFYRERLLLIDDKTASLNAHQSVAGVLGHEMAHQWFGDLVTMNWWNDLWLNEGFATWMGGKPIRAWKPDWAGVDAVGAMDIDSTKSPEPVRSEDPNPPTDIVYGKAANVLHMLEAYEGKEVFRAGVNAYLKAHAFGSVTAEDFWNAQAKASGKPIDKIMPSFIDQPGVPLISVAAQKEGDVTSVTLTQKRFFRDRATFENGSPELWEVPVSIRSAAALPSNAGDDHYVLLTDRTQTFKFKNLPLPILGNARQMGYYRVRYSPEVLSELTRNAETRLTPAERIGLLNDEWALVDSGMAPIGDFLALVEALKDDERGPVIDAYLGKLDTIDTDMVTASDRESYRAWVRDLLRARAKELGWKPVPGEGVEQPGMRASVLWALGRVGHDPDVLATARDLARRYLADPLAIDPSIADTVVNLAALEGDAQLYDEFLAASKTAKSPEEYYRFLGALARFTDPYLLTRTLQLALTPAIRSQDFTQLLGAVMLNPEGSELAWSFDRQHWSEITAKPPGNAAGKVLATASVFCDLQHEQEVKEFFTAGKSSPDAIQKTIESIESCADVKSIQQPHVAAWFEHRENAASRQRSGGHLAQR